MNELLLAQAVVESGWSSTTINLLIGGAVIIISALSAAIVKIIQTLNETKALVDGRYGSLLNEVAELKRLLAISTGSLLDHGAAIAATKTAVAQQAVADKVNGKGGHPT